MTLREEVEELKKQIDEYHTDADLRIDSLRNDLRNTIRDFDNMYKVVMELNKFVREQLAMPLDHRLEQARKAIELNTEWLNEIARDVQKTK